METDGELESGAAAPTGLEEIPTGELVDELGADLKELAAIELRKLGQAAKQGGKKAVAALLLTGAGAALALVGMLVWAFTSVYLLAYVMPLWTSGLIIGGMALTVGGLVAFGGARELQKGAKKATEALEALEEDAEWARETIHEARARRAAT